MVEDTVAAFVPTQKRLRGGEVRGHCCVDVRQPLSIRRSQSQPTILRRKLICVNSVQLKTSMCFLFCSTQTTCRRVIAYVNKRKKVMFVVVWVWRCVVACMWKQRKDDDDFTMQRLQPTKTKNNQNETSPLQK